MNNHARQLLFQLINDHGVEVAKNPQRLNALLKDYAEGQHKREIFLCVQAAREGVVETLQNNKHLPFEAVAAQLTQRLHDDYGIDLHAAKWAVGSWVVALGLTDKFAPSKKTANAASVASKEQLQQAIAKLDELKKAAQQPAPTAPLIVSLIADRYRDNGDGTITDTKTGLQWLRFMLGQTWTGSAPSGEGQRYKWQEITSAAQSFNQAGGFANYTDWQVPSIDELKSIVEMGKKPSINHSAFPLTPASLFWTATSADNNNNAAWSVYFYGGSSYWYGKGSYYYVRLVRK
jgi:hypothetical protein